MKYLASFLFLPFLCIAQWDKESTNDLDQLELFGQVKQLYTDGYYLIPDGNQIIKGNPLPGISFHTIEEFSKEGYLIKRSWMSEDTLYRRIEYRFDEKNRETSSLTFFGPDRLIEQVFQTWSTEDELLSRIVINSSGDTSKAMYNTLDRKGNVSKSLEYYNGELQQEVFFEYNNQNDLLSSKSYRPDGLLNLIMEFLYDENRQLVGISTLAPRYDMGNWPIDTVDIWKEEWIYDGSLLIEHRSTDFEKGEEMKTLFSYSVNGKLYKKDVYLGDELSERQEWNPRTQRQITHEFYGHGGLLNTSWSFEYTLDEQGNWLTQTMLRDGIEERVIERKIEYYQ